jgi:S1-C subfamily serine protease
MNYDQTFVQKTIARIQSYGKKIDFSRPFKTLERKKSVGTGSFVLPPEGWGFDQSKLYILTCAHVVDEADQVTIQVPLVSQKEIPATVLSFVPRHSYDLALIAIEKPDERLRRVIKYIPLGSSENLKQGDKLVALGFPMGQSGIMTSDGVYSGFQHALQHTVPISPGNSGGPLVSFNKKGRMQWIGVNTSGIVDVRASNIGYAVPIEYFKLIAPTLFAQPFGPPRPERVLRQPSFGFKLQESTGTQIKVESNGCEQGMYVFDVDPESPAFKSGISQGDYLCKIEEMQVNNQGEVKVSWNQQPVSVKVALDRMTDINKKYKFVIYKNTLKKCINVYMKPAQLQRGALKFLYPPYDEVEYVALGGIVMMQIYKNHAFNPATIRAFAELSPKERQETNVIVTHIVPGTQADKNILKPSNRISKVNGKFVKTLLDVRSALLEPLFKNNFYYVEIESLNKNKIILLLKDLIQEDIRMKDLNVYNPDVKLMQFFMNFSE